MIVKEKKKSVYLISVIEKIHPACTIATLVRSNYYQALLFFPAVQFSKFHTHLDEHQLFQGISSAIA